MPVLIPKKNKKQQKPKVRVNRPRPAQPISQLNGRSNTMQSFSAPAAFGSTRKSYFRVSAIKNPRYHDAIRVQGQDLLTTGSWVTASDHTLLINVLLDLTTFTGTRLEQYAGLYEKFIFKTLRFHVNSGTGTSNAGSYIMAYDRDPSDATPSASLQGSRQLMSYENSSEFNTWIDGTITCPLDSPETAFFTSPSVGGDERLSTQGQFYLWQLIRASNAGTWTLWIEYDMEFYVPQLDGNFTSLGVKTGINEDPTIHAAIYNLLGLLSTGTWTGTSQVVQTAPDGLPGILLKAGQYIIAQTYGNTGGTVYPGAEVLGAPLSKFTAVDSREQAQINVGSNVVTTGATVAGGPITATLQSGSEYIVQIPASGAWLQAALAAATLFTGAFPSLAYNIKITKVKGSVVI